MKTPNLDHEIERLSLLERTNDLSEYGKELITEYKSIKQALSLHNVSQQRELFKSFLEKVVEEIEMNCGDLSWELQDEAKELLKLLNCG